MSRPPSLSDWLRMARASVRGEGMTVPRSRSQMFMHSPVGEKRKFVYSY